MDFDLGDDLQAVCSRIVEGCRQIHSHLDYRAARGELRDYITNEFLRKYVPDAFGIESGFIITSDGESSLEQDVIIYDKTKTPLLARHGNSQLLPVEGVYITAEVGSSLTFDDLERCAEDVRRIKKLKKSAYLKPPTPVYRIREFRELKDFFNTVSYLIVYDSPHTLKELTERLMEVNERLAIPPQHQIDGVFLMRRGVILNYREVDPGEKMQFMVLEDTNHAYADTEDVLPLFYLAIMSRLGKVWMHGLDLREYIKVPLEPNVLKYIEKTPELFPEEDSPGGPTVEAPDVKIPDVEISDVEVPGTALEAKRDETTGDAGRYQLPS